MSAYRRKVRKIVNRYLRLPALLGLEKKLYGAELPYRCTRIIVQAHPKLGKDWCYACSKITSRGTFVLEIQEGLDDTMLRQAIGHEIGHLLMHEIITTTGNERDQWECLACEIIGALLARTMPEM